QNGDRRTVATPARPSPTALARAARTPRATRQRRRDRMAHEPPSASPALRNPAPFARRPATTPSTIAVPAATAQRGRATSRAYAFSEQPWARKVDGRPILSRLEQQVRNGDDCDAEGDPEHLLRGFDGFGATVQARDQVGDRDVQQAGRR